MKVSRPEDIRNMVLLSHGGVGKTTFVEALLFKTGLIKRLGNVEDGTSTSDFTPEEKSHQISINATFLPCYWDKKKINLIDTPGYIDFIGEVHSSLRAADSALLMACASAGVEVNTRRFWNMVEEKELPRVFFVNKMDREGADFRQAVDQLQDSFGKNIIPLWIPIGAEDNFQGFIDLLEQKAYVNKEWGKDETGEIPAELQDEFTEFRLELLETLAELDDELMMKYLDEEDLQEEELRDALRKGVKSGQVIPVFVGSAAKGIGIEKFLQYAGDIMPDPVEAGEITGREPEGEEITRKPSTDDPFCAQVVKTLVDPYVGRLSIFRVFSGKLSMDSEVYNANKEKTEKVAKIYLLKGKEQDVVEELVAGDIGAVAKLQHTSTADTLCEKENPIVLPGIEFPEPNLPLAAYPVAEGDEEKIGTSLNRFAEEDPTFSVYHNTETKELIIAGMGTMHIDVVKEVSKRKFGVDFETRPPKIAYKETLQKKVEVEEKHKKQTGGRGQYGHVFLRLEPLPRGKGFEFAEEIFGGAIPNQFVPGVEKGVREAMLEGVLAGYPVVDFKATVFDGSYHPVDSSEMAFKLAASKAFKKALQNASPVLLEPIMEVRVEVAEEFMGDVIGDLNSRRGKILGMDSEDGIQVIRAYVPLVEIASYATDLKSITGGQGVFSISLAYYEKVPPKETEKIIAEAKKEEE